MEATRKDLASTKASLASCEVELTDARGLAAGAAKALETQAAEKDVVIDKLQLDLGKVMDELSRVTHDLHTAQDYVAEIQPAADIVFDIRKRQVSRG